MDLLHHLPMTDTQPFKPGYSAVTPGAGAPDKGSQGYRLAVTEGMMQAGFTAPMIEAMLDLDAENFLYVRRVMKGDIPQSLMDELGASIEVSQFHALSAILRIKGGYGRSAPQDPTIGLMAEELCLDPSRASRIAAVLVDRGLVTRGVSQQDGRKSILIPTGPGMALMQGFLKAKWQRTARVFADWTEEEITTFARLFARYAEGMRQHYPVKSGSADA